MQRRFVPLFALTTLVLVSFPAFSSATFIPGPNGKIAFASGRANAEFPAPGAGDDAKARIWVVDYPFGTPVQVTTKPEGVVQHRHPSWSPDHSKIAYAAGPAFGGTYALWIVDLKTGVQREFVSAAAGQDRPSWSPDGTRIAYGSGGNLWVKDADAAVGEPGEQLTSGGAVEERPVWSPDGDTLYYNLGVAGNRDLFAKSPVTPAGAETGVLTDATKDDWQPALSPDGNRLCFLRGGQDDTADIWTVNVSGSGAAAFAENAGIGELNCVWSPDGTRILYTEGIFSAGQIRSRNINKGDYQLHNPFNVASHFDGNADWATNFSPTCDSKNANVGVNGFVSILLSCTDPDSGFGKAPPTPDPLGDSSMEIVTNPQNGTLGSLEGGKVIYTPNKDFKGSDSFTYTGEDNESTAQPATVTIQVANPTGPAVVDTTAPSISGLRVSLRKWRLGKGLATISKAPVGTTIFFNLSEPAAATLSFQRFVPARKGGKPRYVNAGSLKALAAKAGQNKVRFRGRLTLTRSLAPGRYRVAARARDAAGNQSPKRTGPTFTIVNE